MDSPNYQSDKEKRKILQEFEEELNEGMVDLDTEFSSIVDENFWDLIECL